jgi:predicted dehydrogenase
MSKAWLNAAKAHGQLQVVGLVDVRREAAEQRANEYQLGVNVVFDTVAQALARTRPDLLFDVTIPDAHCSVTLAALKRGVHVLGEKPMAPTLSQARRMAAAAQASGKLYAVMQNRRFEPEIRAVQAALAAGAIGPVAEIHSDFFLGPHFGGFREAMEHPLLIDMAIHTFDQARFIGGVDPVAVYCHSFNPAHSWYKGHASAQCIFEMSNGVVFNYRGSWCAQGHATSWHAQWRVVGGQGTLLWEGPRIDAQAVVPDGAGFTHSTRPVPVTVTPMPQTGHAALINEFVDCVQHGRTPMTHCQDNIKSLAMVFAAVKSARTGKRVKVEW